MSARLSPCTLCCVQIDELHQGKREKRVIQYSKSSKARRSSSPRSSCTMRPPMRSIEGISTAASQECLRGAVPPSAPHIGDAEVKNAGSKRGIGFALLENLGEMVAHCLPRRRRSRGSGPPRSRQRSVRSRSPLACRRRPSRSAESRRRRGPPPRAPTPRRACRSACGHRR